MTVAVKPRPPIAAASHVYMTPVVHELPPVARPGAYADIW